MVCPYYHKLCKSGCDKHVCRAFFPERQPHVMKDMEPICESENYAEECQNYAAGTVFKAERRAKQLNEHCRFASNSVCGKPDEWWCKGGVVPFKLYPVKDEQGELVYSKEQLKETCWSGDNTIYEECPRHKEGLAFREEVARLKMERNITI